MTSVLPPVPVVAVAPAADHPLPPDVQALGDWLADNKAQDITVLPIADKTVMTDYLIVATGTSRAQIHALADKIIETFATPAHPIRRDGYGATDWVVLDMGAVMVHLFRPEARALYNLEGMWS
ncbi:MAG: ribosome silencing factor [Alphaproteobacteria bacterium]